MISFVDCIDGETEAPKEDTAFADRAPGLGVRVARNMPFVVSFQFRKQHPGTSKDVVQDLSIHWESRCLKKQTQQSITRNRMDTFTEPIGTRTQ